MSEEKPNGFVFGVDLDGVCGDYVAALKPFVAKRTGRDPSDLTDDVTWNLAEWGIDREEYEKYHGKAVTEARMFLNMPAYPNVSESLWSLSEMGIWIRVITHRMFMSGSHALIASDTVQWLDDKNIPYRDICFIGAKHNVEADIYIEDSPANIASLQRCGKQVIVFDQPYNREVQGQRAFSWQEAEQMVKAAKEFADSEK